MREGDGEPRKKKRSVGDIAVGFWMLARVDRIVLILAAVTLFAVRVTWPHPPWALILLLVAGQAAMQFSIAILNDYIDRHLDAAVGKNRPIVLGLIRPHEALLVGLFMIAVMVVILLPLRLFALLASANSRSTSLFSGRKRCCSCSTSISLPSNLPINVTRSPTLISRFEPRLMVLPIASAKDAAARNPSTVFDT